VFLSIRSSTATVFFCCSLNSWKRRAASDPRELEREQLGTVRIGAVMNAYARGREVRAQVVSAIRSLQTGAVQAHLVLAFGKRALHAGGDARRFGDRSRFGDRGALHV